MFSGVEFNREIKVVKLLWNRTQNSCHFYTYFDYSVRLYASQVELEDIWNFFIISNNCCCISCCCLILIFLFCFFFFHDLCLNYFVANFNCHIWNCKCLINWELVNALNRILKFIVINLLKSDGSNRIENFHIESGFLKREVLHFASNDSCYWGNRLKRDFLKVNNRQNMWI